MPLFEYQCSQCGKPFEKLVLSSSGAAQLIACPACGSAEVRKKISSFASKVSGGSAFSLGSSSASSSSSCNTGGG